MVEMVVANLLILKMIVALSMCESVGSSCKACTFLGSGFIPFAENMAP